MRYFIFFFFFTIATQAQDTLLLKGYMLNDSIEKASLNVVNISLRKGAITDLAGQFTIPVRVNDTINISAVQYEPRQFIVSDKLFRDREVALYLVPKITELDEVKLSSIELTGNLKNDLEQVVVEKVFRPKDFGIQENTAPIRTVEERRLYTATSSGGIPGIGALINALSGRTKMLKKHVAVSRLQLKVERTRERFSDSIYSESLKIPHELIEDFVFYALEDETALLRVDLTNNLELLTYFELKAPLYLALKRREEALPALRKEKQ